MFDTKLNKINNEVSKKSYGFQSIRFIIVFVVFTTLIFNNLTVSLTNNFLTVSLTNNFENINSTQNSINLDKYFANSNLKLLHFRLLNKNFSKIYLNHLNFKETGVITQKLNEIVEFYEVELDDFVDTFSKDYKFYNNFIIKSIDLDRFSLNHATTIPLYILFHCLKIQLSLI